MSYKRWIIAFLIVSLTGCFSSGKKVYETERQRSLMLCEVGKNRITMMRRFSFDIPIIFQQAPCGVVSSGFTYDKLADAVYIGSAGGYSYGGVSVDAAQYSMSFRSFNGRAVELFMPMEDFSEYMLAKEKFSPVSGYPDKVSSVRFGANECKRYYYLRNQSHISMWNEEIHYWCWEKQSGLSIPFHISAFQRQRQGAPGVDMEKEFIKPFFDSLAINHLASAEIELIQRSRLEACENQKKRFDENKIYGSDYPDRRFFKTRLHYCGYDIPLPNLETGL
ncbi:hypothetical protein [Pseudomonas nitroreducens]|uniref:hypothetical protein n=1 Tax=Pseudomonas nitroreducens TaxID=46680 RepID=UPI0011329EE4|nr:hypothetical protein [Pseudomonas nitroreducens]